MKTNQKGFSILIVILMIAIIAAIGILAFKVVHDKNKDKRQDTTQNSQKNSSSTNTPAKTPTEATAPVDIPSWGVKITLRDANKVQLTTENKSGKLLDVDSYEGVAVPKFVAGAVQDPTCIPSLSLFRSKTSFSQAAEQKKIGDYYYMITGAPGPCDNDADNQLKTRFLKDFTTNNLSEL